MKALFMNAWALPLSLLLPLAATPQAGAGTLSADPGTAGADQANWMLAEYRADRGLEKLDAAAPAWQSDVATSVTSMKAGEDIRAPLDLQSSELAGSLERRMYLGPLVLSGALDVQHRQTQWVGQPYSQQQSIQFGPKVFFGPGSVTHLYYGIGQEDLLDHQYARIGDADSTRTGLTHTWSWGSDRHIRIGYEFEQGSREDLYQDMQGHSVSVSGWFPVGWGLRAQLLADYSRNSYPEYAGSFGLASDRREFKATLSRSFGERLSGDLHYSYYDEDFGDSAFTQRRRAFGVHLRYRY